MIVLSMELALWCDLRVADDDAVLGVFCRRWGVPLIDGGTVRLPRLIGVRAAFDIILAGKSERAAKALKALGLRPNIIFSPGGLDANWLDKHGIPTVTIGAGQREERSARRATVQDRRGRILFVDQIDGEQILQRGSLIGGIERRINLHAIGA